MRSMTLPLRILAVASSIAISGAVQAALVVFNSQSSFFAAVTSPGVDTYTNVSVTSATASPMTRQAGPYVYMAASPDGFFGAGSAANPWLSTNTAADSITFSNFSGSASAIGGFFVGSDVNGAFASGSLRLIATDSLGAISNQTIAGGVTSFLGFVSTGTLASLVVSAVQPAGGFLWPSVDNLSLALAAPSGPAPIPEPTSGALLLIALAGLAAVASRRTHEVARVGARPT
jgi:hypothetical protein